MGQKAWVGLFEAVLPFSSFESSFRPFVFLSFLDLLFSFGAGVGADLRVGGAGCVSACAARRRRTPGSDIPRRFRSGLTPRSLALAIQFRFDAELGLLGGRGADVGGDWGRALVRDDDDDGVGVGPECEPGVTV
eukprot:237913-Rhodomonas_salina.2